jgi:hypothetical protein
MMSKFRIKWVDHGVGKSTREPNPAYPDGVDADCSRGAERSCTAQLPYPAEGIGMHIVECTECGFRAAITAAGRADDPRSVTIPCKCDKKH